MNTTDMSPYEQRAWDRIQHWRRRELKPQRNVIPRPVRRATSRGAEVAKDAAQRGWSHVPRHDDITGALLEAMSGLNNLVTDVALKTLREEAVVEAFSRHGYPVHELSDLLGLDLEDIDRIMPDLRFRYSAGLATEGAAAGVAAGGGTMLAGAGGIAGAGAGAVPGVAFTTSVLVADITAVLTVATRGAAHYASYYGYDVSEEAERAYLVGTMSVGLAAGQSGKTRAFAQLHKLVGLLARDATWKQLNQSFFVRYVGALYARLGERLVKRKLGQALPVAGAFIGAGLNYQFARRVTTTAYWVGRERFLMDKYGLHGDLDPDLAADVIDVEPAAERLQILSPVDTDEPHDQTAPEGPV